MFRVILHHTFRGAGRGGNVKQACFLIYLNMPRLDLNSDEKPTTREEGMEGSDRGLLNVLFQHLRGMV
jgi:hypothetical protein